VQKRSASQQERFPRWPNQDIKMDELVMKVRQVQPEVIVVDRAVHGKNQNYLTPENMVPGELLPYPWESCIIMGGGWSYSFNPEFKSSRELIHMLSDIVAKGGNLLLNIGPGPDGTWYDEAYVRLKDMGDWLKINGNAIYGTRPVKPYVSGNIRFTKQNDGAVNAIYLIPENEPAIPSEIVLPGIKPRPDAKITIYGIPSGNLKWKMDGENCKVFIPANTGKKIPSAYAFTLRISGVL
jgi:alpha-L-fucosidase